MVNTTPERTLALEIMTTDVDAMTERFKVTNRKLRFLHPGTHIGIFFQAEWTAHSPKNEGTGASEDE